MIANRDRQKRLLIQEYRRRVGNTVTIEQLAILTGVKVRQVRRLASFELITPVKREREPEFQIETVPRVRKLMRLHHDLGISWSSMAVVIDLLERIEKLERKLQT